MATTHLDRDLHEIGEARLTARLLRHARQRVGCDNVRDGGDSQPCWQFYSNGSRCPSCDATLVISHALDAVLTVERRARYRVNAYAERMARKRLDEGER